MKIGDNMKKGFTLIELLGVIIILGVIGLTTYSAIDRNIKEGRKKTCLVQEKNIIEAAKTYLIDNKISEGNVKMLKLKNDGYIDENLKNPMTDELYKDKSFVSVSNGKYTMHYKEEKDCNGQIDTTNIEIIYRRSSNTLTNNSSIAGLTKGTDYITEDDYPLYSSREAFFGSKEYLKHIVVNDIITESHICFIVDSEYCLQGGVDERSLSNKPVLKANAESIKKYQSYYNLSYYSSPGVFPGCLYNDYVAECYHGGYPCATANVYGEVSVHEKGTSACNIYSDSSSNCNN